VPAGTPAPAVNKVREDTVKVLAQPDVRSTFTKLGLDPVGNTSAEFSAIIRSDIAKWAKVIKEAGITASD
jgi:tripartite-type tricarboxylate transporter receptor subunit TctC